MNLKTIICASSDDVAESVAAFNPDFIAIEPPELIGGNISVSTAKPEVITNTVKKVNKISKIPVLCGAGIKTKSDVENLNVDNFKKPTQILGVANGKGNFKKKRKNYWIHSFYLSNTWCAERLF